MKMQRMMLAISGPATLLGALVIGYLKTILDINGFDPDKQLMITGGILALAVFAQGLRRR